MLLLLLACASDPKEGACTEFATDPAAPDGVLTNDDDCGTWSLAVDDQLVVSVYVTVEQATCEAEMGDGLDLPYEPIYTNLSDDGAKVTFQFKATAAAQDSSIAITCDEGTTWNAHLVIGG
jgi:hypothetical protein